MKPEISYPPPPENLKLADGEIHIFCAWLDVPPARRAQLTETLSEDERVRAARFVFERDKNRFVAGRGVLREILGWLLQVEPERLAFSYSARGKPQLAAPVAGRSLHFNLAHSEALVVYAVSRAQEVGIDVELIRPVREAEEIAAQFFSEGEFAKWHSLPNDRKTEAFFNCWTRKEACLKSTGQGIGGTLNQIDISFISGGPEPVPDTAKNSPVAAPWHIQALTPASSYAGALAVKHRPMHVTCWTWRGHGRPIH
jgi:4'-phosphopantetheinyl transferase